MAERIALLKAGLPAVTIIVVLGAVAMSGQGPALAGAALLLIGALGQAMTASTSRGDVEPSRSPSKRRDALILAGWVVIAFGAFFSFLGALPVPPPKEGKKASDGWWIFSHEWMLQLFSGTAGALIGAAVAAAAAVFVLNRTNEKQQGLWDASKRDEEARTSKAHHTQSAAELSEGVLKLREAIFVNEQAVIDAAYLSSRAHLRWKVALYGDHEDFDSEIGRWVTALCLDARALRNLRDHEPATGETVQEFEKLRIRFDDNMVDFVKTITRWVAEEESRDKHILALAAGHPGDIASHIRDELKIPATWLSTPEL